MLLALSSVWFIALFIVLNQKFKNLVRLLDYVHIIFGYTYTFIVCKLRKNVFINPQY